MCVVAHTTGFSSVGLGYTSVCHYDLTFDGFLCDGYLYQLPILFLQFERCVLLLPLQGIGIAMALRGIERVEEVDECVVATFAASQLNNPTGVITDKDVVPVRVPRRMGLHIVAIV